LRRLILRKAERSGFLSFPLKRKKIFVVFYWLKLSSFGHAKIDKNEVHHKMVRDIILDIYSNDLNANLGVIMIAAGIKYDSLYYFQFVRHMLVK
jgi:hypothetical protein